MNNAGRTLLILLAVFVGGFYALRKPILQGQVLSSLAPVVAITLPPGDLYLPTLHEAINVATNATIDVTFTNRYVGRYVFGVFVQNMPQTSRTMPNFELHVQFLDGTRELAELTTGEPKYTFWKIHGGDGFVFAAFTVPLDISRGEPIRCKATVTRTDPEFQELHGPVVIFAAKDAEF